MTPGARAAEIVVAGHTCLDIIPSLDSMAGRAEELFVPGTLVKVGPATVATGGAVPNAGMALHRLGVAARLMGKLGDDLLGRAVMDILRGHAPSLAEDMIVAGGEHTSYSVVISPPGVDRTFLHHPGVNDTFVADDVPYERVAGAKIFHFGYPPLMRRMYADGGENLSRMLQRVRALGVAVSLDMSMPDVASDAGRADWLGILERALPHVDLFLPSLDETLLMLERDTFVQLSATAGPVGIASQVNASLLQRLTKRLLEMGAAVVALKLGDSGLYLQTSDNASRLAAVGGVDLARPAWRGRELLAPCFEVDVAGTTGSGDCTIAGFLAAVLNEATPEGAMRAAVAVGACSVEKADAASGVPTWKLLQSRLATDWRQREVGVDLTGWHFDAASGLWHGPNDKR
jgi:sugar/nucleoside kinase (ribokinase family)